MKVLCIAMGTPPPHVTLYLNGHPLRTEVTRHMVTNIHNVSRGMEHVSCYADNGYGTPMIASRKITIARQPTVLTSRWVRGCFSLVNTLSILTSYWSNHNNLSPIGPIYLKVNSFWSKYTKF